MTGRFVWRTYVTDLTTFSKNRKLALPLFVLRTTAHFPLTPLCTVVGTDKVSTHVSSVVGFDKLGIVLCPVVDTDQMSVDIGSAAGIYFSLNCVL